MLSSSSLASDHNLPDIMSSRRSGLHAHIFYGIMNVSSSTADAASTCKSSASSNHRHSRKNQLSRSFASRKHSHLQLFYTFCRIYSLQP